MVKIRIPKQDITTKTIQFKGREQVITVFMAQLEDGTNYPVCEAWGNKKKALEEVMGTDKCVEADKIEHNAQYNKYNVYFPRGFGGEGEFRSKFGGGGGWSPAGYKGKPVSENRWWDITEKRLAQAVRLVRHAMTAERFDKMTPEQVAEFAMPVAQDLVSQFWIEVEKNVTFPEHCEPTVAASAESGTGQVIHSPGGASASAMNGSASAAEQAIRDEVAAWAIYDEAVRDAMTARINALDVQPPRRVELHGMVFAKRKELQAQSAA